jgi:hypothetical protein
MVDETDAIEIAKQTIAARETRADRAIYKAHPDGNRWVVGVLTIRGRLLLRAKLAPAAGWIAAAAVSGATPTGFELSLMRLRRCGRVG